MSALRRHLRRRRYLKDHRFVRDRCSDYLDNELDDIDREIVIAHLEMCPECGSWFRSLKETVRRIAGLGEAPPAQAPPDLCAEVIRRLRSEA